MHKHRGSSKIKYEHHIIQGLRPILESMQKWSEIKSIIPGVIKRTSSNSGNMIIKVQYKTSSGIKCLAINSSGCVQEVFIVSSESDKLINKIKKISNTIK